MDNQSRWQDVIDGNAAADGQFVYAVRSTGIYCRPSCKSRRPKPENVEYFELAEAAESHGYRACKRCKPNDVAPPNAAVKRVQEACRYIQHCLADGLDGPPTLKQIASEVGGGSYHLQRTFKSLIGVSPAEYGDALRLVRLKQGLKGGEGVTAALYDAGYGGVSRLYEKSDGQLGMTPATYAHGGAGAQLAYTIVDSPLNRLFVAATDKGVCFLSLGEDDDALLAECQDEFPGAELIRDDAVLRNWAAVVIAYLEGKIPHPDLPLDVRATAFQRRVWQELMRIPSGLTRTYTEIADELLGNPKARRAVARACATNPVSLIIPCHRVKRSDGGLGGYRWGLSRKERLIAHERAMAALSEASD